MSMGDRRPVLRAHLRKSEAQHEADRVENGAIRIPFLFEELRGDVIITTLPNRLK
jgi:hypothetical protein